MSSIQIPNLPAVIGLDGSELFEGVQAGYSVKISLAQMIAAARITTPITFPIAVSVGGTGLISFTVGDIMYASATQTFSKLADVALGNAIISGGVGAIPSYGKIGLTTHVSGVLPVANGGTNQSAALTQYGMIYGDTTTSMASTAAGTTTTVLHGNAAGAPTFSAVSLTADVSGVLPVANGGTNITSYTIGSIPYASTAGILSQLLDVAIGNAIISGGVGAAPSYGKIGLTTHVSGTLPVANGGTNITSYAIGDILYASTTGILSSLADVAIGNAIISGGVGIAPSYGKIGLTTHVSGTLPVANGGTGVTTAPAEAARILGYTATATAAGTTVLTNTSTQYQLFTGATTQTITLPVTSTLGTGWSFHIVNNSTGSLTVNSSGGNLVATIIAGLSAMITCIGTTLTTAADWEAGFTDFQTLTGTGAAVLGTGPTITGAVSANATSGNGAIVGQQTLNLAANVTAFGPAIGDFFGATSAISLEASSVYEIVIYAVMTKTTAGTATWTLTASSAPTRIIGTYQASPVTGIAAGAPITGFTGSQGATTAAFSATGSLTTAVNHAFQFVVQVQTNAATSFKLQLTQSAGTATPLAGSYYTVKKISATTGTFV